MKVEDGEPISPNKIIDDDASSADLKKSIVISQRLKRQADILTSSMQQANDIISKMNDDRYDRTSHIEGDFGEYDNTLNASMNKKNKDPKD